MTNQQDEQWSHGEVGDSQILPTPGDAKAWQQDAGTHRVPTTSPGVPRVPSMSPKRLHTGQPSGKRSGVHLRKSGQPRSRSTMVQGARVAWHRV